MSCDSIHLSKKIRIKKPILARFSDIFYYDCDSLTFKRPKSLRKPVLKRLPDLFLYRVKERSILDINREIIRKHLPVPKIGKIRPFWVREITFLNRWGALQDLFFHKKSVETLETRSENFKRSIFKARSVSLSEAEEPGEPCQEDITFNTYSTTAHAKKTFNANGVESILLNTGFVDERMNVYFEELMVSEYIWLTDEQDDIYPVTLKDSNFTYRTGLNDRLINYTMNFEKAFDFVNNIR